jgi:hypothetical protein
MLSLDGSVKVLEGSTVTLCADGDIRIFGCHHQCSVLTDAALGTMTFNHVTLFLLAIMPPFCCTAHGCLLVYDAYSHVIMCNWLYLLAAPQTILILELTYIDS